MNRRTATVIVCVVDTAAWVLIAIATVMSGSDPATKGLDEAAGLAATALFLVTGTPALVLVWLRRAPVTALVLALAFPVVLLTMFIAAIMAFG